MRKFFNLTTVASGIAIGMIVAGALALIGGSYARDVVHDQLVPQQIYFPEKGEELPANLNQYAGQQVDTAKEAEAYANDYIGLHLEGIADGKSYAEVSAASCADPENAELAEQRQSLFMGETLRGTLLSAWGWGTVGTIADDRRLRADRDRRYPADRPRRHRAHRAQAPRGHRAGRDADRRVVRAPSGPLRPRAPSRDGALGASPRPAPRPCSTTSPPRADVIVPMANGEPPGLLDALEAAPRPPRRRPHPPDARAASRAPRSTARCGDHLRHVSYFLSPGHAPGLLGRPHATWSRTTSPRCRTCCAPRRSARSSSPRRARPTATATSASARTPTTSRR